MALCQPGRCSSRANGLHRYAQHQGGYESDLTLVRRAKDVYYLVTSTAQGHHDAHWIRRHAPKDAQFTITEVTSSYGVLSVMGPQSIEFLQPLTDTDLSKEAFGFGIARNDRGHGYRLGPSSFLRG